MEIKTFWLILILGAPLASALILMIFRRRVGQMAGGIAGVGIALSVVAIFALLPVLQHGEEPTLAIAWIPALDIELDLHVDWLTLPFLITEGGVSLLAIIYAWGYHHRDERTPYFYALLLLFAIGMAGTTLADDMFLFYIFWELMLVASCILILVWGDGAQRSAVALKYFIFTHMGSLLVLAALVMLYNAAGTDRFSVLRAGVTLPASQIPWLIAFFIIGFCVKMAIFPLHLWLPDAHTVAPMPVTIMLAAAMLSMGTYGILRFPMSLFSRAQMQPFAVPLMVAGVISEIYGALMALAEQDVKRIVAYSSVSQMGYILFGLGTLTHNGITGATLHVVFHAIVKALLFMVLGLVIRATGKRQLSDLGGLAHVMPVTAICAAVGALAISATPPLCMFDSEWLLFAGGFETPYTFLTIVALFGSLLTVAYALWLVGRIFLGAEPTEGWEIEKPPLNDAGTNGLPGNTGANRRVVPGPTLKLGRARTSPAPRRYMVTTGDTWVIAPLLCLGAGAFGIYLVARLITSRNEILALCTTLVFGAALVSLGMLARRPGISPSYGEIPTWGNFATHGVVLQAEPGALLIISVALGLGMCSALYSGCYLSLDRRYTTYYPLILLLILGITGMVMTTDLFNLYLYCELMSIAAYILVAFRRTTDTAIEAGFKYLMMGSVGTLLMLLGITMIYRETGTVVVFQSLATPGIWSQVGLACLWTGLGVKSALVPVHTWLPDAHGRAPSSISALLSGIVIQSAFYVLLKVSLGLGFPAKELGAGLIGLSLVNMTLGNVMALVQTNLKRMLAYSTIAQMGYIIFGIGVGLRYEIPEAIQAGFFLLIAHAVMKALAFLSKGVCHFYCHITNIIELRGMFYRLPLATITLALALAGLAGIPPLAGFVSKWFLLSETLRAGDAWVYGAVILFLLNSLLALGYYLPVIATLFAPDTEPETEKITVSVWMTVPLLILSILVIGIGIFPGIWWQWVAEVVL